MRGMYGEWPPKNFKQLDEAKKIEYFNKIKNMSDKKNLRSFTDPEFKLALVSAVDSRNRHVNRSGYSAQQRVFGTALRLPGSLLSDDPLDRIAMREDPTTACREVRVHALLGYLAGRRQRLVHR